MNWGSEKSSSPFFLWSPNVLFSNGSIQVEYIWNGNGNLFWLLMYKGFAMPRKNCIARLMLNLAKQLSLSDQIWNLNSNRDEKERAREEWLARATHAPVCEELCHALKARTVSSNLQRRSFTVSLGSSQRDLYRSMAGMGGGVSLATFFSHPLSFSWFLCISLSIFYYINFYPHFFKFFLSFLKFDSLFNFIFQNYYLFSIRWSRS